MTEAEASKPTSMAPPALVPLDGLEEEPPAHFVLTKRVVCGAALFIGATIVIVVALTHTVGTPDETTAAPTTLFAPTTTLYSCASKYRCAQQRY